MYTTFLSLNISDVYFIFSFISVTTVEL